MKSIAFAALLSNYNDNNNDLEWFYYYKKH